MAAKQITPLLTVASLEGLKAFYTTHFGCEVKYEVETYLEVALPGDAQQSVAYMLSESEEWPVGQGKGLCWCLPVDDVDAEHDRLRGALPIARPLQDNPWGDRSFIVVDPAGVSVYIYSCL